jgi:hypothetical protein
MSGNVPSSSEILQIGLKGLALPVIFANEPFSSVEHRGACRV